MAQPATQPNEAQAAPLPALPSLGKHDVIKEIGRGAMATVYLARDKLSNRDVAIKVANPERAGNRKKARLSKKLFFNEARAASLLHHPNIVSIEDAGVHDALRYIVMEYVPGGRTLYNYCHPQHLLPVRSVLQIAYQCATALDYAHRRGVIHRDIKPKNILLGPEHTAKISDFGIALLVDNEAADTQVTGYIGSPLYMAPEQLRGEMVSNQTDLFALGVVMYQLLTGRHPFGAKKIEVITHRISREPHQPIHELRPELPPDLSRVIDRTLKKHPAGRYSMGLDLVGDLSLIDDELQVPLGDPSSENLFAEARRLAFFKSFSDAELWEVLNVGVRTTYERGAKILEPNESASSFNLIFRGQVKVKHPSGNSERLGPNSCFGDLGTSRRAEQGALVKAVSATTLLQLPSALPEQTSPGCAANLRMALLDSLSARLADHSG